MLWTIKEKNIPKKKTSDMKDRTENKENFLQKSINNQNL